MRIWLLDDKGGMMKYRELHQERLLSKLHMRGKENLHLYTLEMNKQHQERMQVHVRCVEVTQHKMAMATQEIADCLEKLTRKPRWKFWN